MLALQVTTLRYGWIRQWQCNATAQQKDILNECTTPHLLSSSLSLSTLPWICALAPVGLLWHCVLTRVRGFKCRAPTPGVPIQCSMNQVGFQIFGKGMLCNVYPPWGCKVLASYRSRVQPGCWYQHSRQRGSRKGPDAQREARWWADRVNDGVI